MTEFNKLIESTDLTAQDNGATRAKLRRLASEQALLERVSPMFYDWIISLRQEWDLTFTDEQLKALVFATMKLMEERGLSALSPKSYDYCRRVFSKQGLLPEGLLTPDELLAERIQHSDLSSHAARTEFAQESRRIRDGA
jgi:hypothetical protein